MPESLDIEYLKPFIGSSIEAAARFRRVLIVMVTASVLGFGAFWNSTSLGWFSSRVELSRKAEKYLTLRDMSSKLALLEPPEDSNESDEERRLRLKKVKDEKPIIFRDANRLLRMEAPTHAWVSNLNELENELNSKEYDQAKEWINLRGFYNTNAAMQYAQKLDDARTLNVLLVHTPFFGTVFDVNALGVLGGFTFMVILILFRFTLWREYNNLRLTFLEARREHLSYCYKSLAMQQVLTVPPTLSSDSPVPQPSGKLVRVLYLPPLIVQTLIVFNDLRTIRVGWIITPVGTCVSVIFGFGFLLVIAFFTAKCWQLSNRIDFEWETWEPLAKRASSALL